MQYICVLDLRVTVAATSANSAGSAGSANKKCDWDGNSFVSALGKSDITGTRRPNYKYRRFQEFGCSTGC